jgi:hypothetical protein
MILVACVFLGDSIAVGIGNYRPECETVAKVGITSGRYIQTMLVNQTADVAVISLGVNDDPSMPTLENLRTVRAEVSARQVVWIIPNVRDYARNAIRQVAAENSDQTLDLRRYESLIAPDRIHPTGTGYMMIAGNLRSGVGVGQAPVEVAEAEPELPPRRRIYRLEARQFDLGRYELGRTALGRLEYGRPIYGFGRVAASRQAYERRVVTHMSATRLAHAETLWREPGWRVQPAMMRTMPVAHEAHPVKATPAAAHATLPQPPVPPHPAAIAPRVPQRVTIFRTFHDFKTGHRQTS